MLSKSKLKKVWMKQYNMGDNFKKIQTRVLTCRCSLTHSTYYNASGPPEHMGTWGLVPTIFWDLACHFQNCKLEVCTINGSKVTKILLSLLCSNPFRRACSKGSECVHLQTAFPPMGLELAKVVVEQ